MADTTTYSDSDFLPVDSSTVAAPAASAAPASYTDADFSPLPTPVKVDKVVPDTVMQNAASAVSSSASDYYNKAVGDVTDTIQGVHDYFTNFHANHEVVPSKPVSLEELSAMKARGIDPFHAAGIDGTLTFDPNSPSGYSYPPTYKTTPGEDLSSVGNTDKHPSVPGYLLNKSFASKVVQDIASPHLDATRLYQTIQDTLQQQKIVANPSKYTKAEVTQAQQTLDEYKQQNSLTTLQKTAEGIKNIVQNPVDAITSFTDPAFLAAPEFKLGAITYGMDLEKATTVVKTASDIVASAQKIKDYAAINNVANKATVIAKADKYIKVYGNVAAKAATNARRITRVTNVGNVTGAAMAGAGINAEVTQQAQVGEQGFSNQGDIQASSLTGGVLGGPLGALGLGGEGDIPKTHPDTVDGTPPAKGPVTAREPGQPLPSTTPVDATKVVPYYGGVNAEGTVIHISKDTPTHIEMKDKTGNPVLVPVRQTVAHHESIEHPLMHLTGSVSDAQMQLIKERMGPYAHFEPGVEEKLRNGTALSYSQAHDIATRSENHLVEQMYGVDHNVYQDALKPHIAKVAEDSAKATASDIPANLDTKPYDNMGHPEQLHDQGARPAQDAGQPGAKDNIAPVTDEDISPVTSEQPTPSGETNTQLPQHLKGSKPWYSFGSKRFQLQFANDLDKASYIAAGSTLSKRDAEYVKFVMDHLHLTEAEVRARGKEIKNRIKAEAKDKEIPAGKKAGVINIRHLAAAGLTLGAAGYGAYQAGPGHRQEGIFKGLFGGMTMFGHQAIFAGARADTFDPARAAEAIRIKEEGKTPEQINFKTGMHEGAGGHWYHELSDHNAVVHIDKIFGDGKVAIELRKGKGVPLSSLMDHAELDKAYPGLADKIHVRMNPKQDGAYYDFNTGNITISTPDAYPKTGLDTFKNVLLHEVNHAVQHYEGFPRGDSPQTHIKFLQQHVQDLDRQVTDLESRIRESQQEGNARYALTLSDERDALEEKINKLTPEAISKIAWDRYHRSAGENMSVAVQERADLTPEQRRMQVPKTEYRNEGQIVRYNTEPSPHLTGKLSNSPEGIAAHEMPISDHLQKTGEMDDEGKLSGMVLPEDKLPNENEVLAKAAQNDQGAISKLYKQYMPRLIRNARGLMRTAGPRLGMDAEDLAMHVFHKAILHLKSGSFNGDSSFYTWMHSILRNTGLNEIARSGRTVPTESIHGDTHDAFGAPVSNVKETARNVNSGEGSPEEHMVAQQTSNMIAHAISKLPQDIREAIKAYEFEDKSYEEIANEQGVPVGTVRSRLNRGRDMIEESIKRGHGANFRKQQGFATVNQMKRAALLGIGAFAGYTLGGQDHHWKDAFYGALAGIGAGAVTFEGIARVVKDVRSADNLPRASGTLDKLEGNLAKLQRHTDDIQAKMKALQGANSLDIAHSLEGDTSIKLAPEQEKVKETARVLYQHVRDMAKAVGMSMEELANYTTHLFKPTETNKAIIDAFNKQQSTPLSKSSPFTKVRKLRMSLADAIGKGMELKHDNFADTFAEYYKSMMGAIHTKLAIDTLKGAADLEGRKLIVRSSMAPHGYQVINHPALRGLSVHPAIAAEMSHMFDVHTPTHLGFAFNFINSAMKRIAFMGSLFHGQTLADVQMGMSLNPYHNIKTTLQALTGSTEFQKAINNPQPGDMVDKILETGQKVPSNSVGFTEDLGRSMGPGFKFLEDQMNKLFPGLGNLPRAAAAIDHAYQWIIFNRLGGGLMGQGTHINFMKLKANWVDAVSKDPTKVIPSDEDLRRRAASMTSVSFGSLNWRRMANEVSNKYMRSFLMSTFSPSGRRAIQSIMLAPEWLTSTTMHWTKALFGKGEGSPIHPQNAVDLHRAWLLKSLIYSTLFGNALNYMFSGHSMMENKDKFMIDLGDGQKTPWMKELSDLPRLVMDPAQEILNKLSPAVRLIGQQLTGKQYLSANGHAPPLKTVGDRVQNAVETASPFSMSQNNTGGIAADVSSMLGHPIYGMKSKDKMQMLMQRRQEALKEKMAKMSGGQ